MQRFQVKDRRLPDDSARSTSPPRPERVSTFLQTRRNLAQAIACVAVTISSAVAFADSVDSPRKFLGYAIQDGRAEIEACQLALHTSSNPSVKAFARRMIADHTALDARIGELAKRKGYSLPDGESIGQHATYMALKPLIGHAFDKRFMKHNVSDHKEDIEQFSKQAQQGSDADIRTLASGALPTLREHLKLAEQTQAAVDR
ncbi:DUF4142 domain-containing protein [Paraburkholderia fungorum]|uniref:DUF4142 domain-containing protein n=1 Tax=Paraburkholderia TaxID=1822464 RepID=UPI0038B833AD